MGKLTNDEIKEIIKRASILQKFYEQSLGSKNSLQPDEDDQVFDWRFSKYKKTLC